MSLHEEVGPARTTVSAIADRAGVQRLTVYRHFPEEREMLRACSTRWAELHPLPAMAPDARSPAGALRELYAWYRDNAGMLTNVYRDAETMPGVKDVMRGMERELDELATRIDRACGRRSADRHRTIRHAVSFGTWQSLSALTRDDRKAADLALRWIEACA